MEEIQGYAFQITTSLPFEATIQLATDLLRNEGFGVLTEIDVKEYLKKKLGLDYKPYRILGACNPQISHQILELVPQIGVLLPCNVAVWDEGDHRVVAAMDPMGMSRLISQAQVLEIAAEVSHRIRRVLEAIERSQ